MARLLLLPISPESKRKRARAKLPPVVTSRYQLYQRLGWTKGQQHSKRLQADLRLSELATIAEALGVPVGEYCAEVWKYQKAGV